MRIGVVDVYVSRRARRMHIKPDRHCRIRNLAVRHHVRQPNVVARTLHLHPVTVIPIKFDVLNFNVADIIDVDQRLPAQE